MNHQDTNTADSIDANTTQKLIGTLVDGQNGYSTAADKLESDGHTELASDFRARSAERGAMADRLRTVAAVYGDHVDSDGSLLAAAHRGWISLKDAVTGTDPDRIITAAITGEKYAIDAFDSALGTEISTDLRTIVREQRDVVVADRDRLQTLVSTAS